MSQTFSGYTTSGITLSNTSTYLSPTTISGTINAQGSAIYVYSPWSIDVTGSVISEGFFGIFGQQNATITNDGLIHSRPFSGIFLAAGGELINESSGTLIGGTQGLYAYYKYAATVTNAGYILGGTALKLGGGGYISNSSTGTIIGEYIAVDLRAAGTLINSGHITDSDSQGIGVSLAAGTILNTGTIEGVTAIIAAGTVINAGLIEGETLDNNAGIYTPSSNGTAIAFTAPGLFIDDATGIILGSVTGNGGTLEFGPGRLTLDGLGSQFSGFSQDIFSPGAEASVRGVLSGFGTISGFTYPNELAVTDRTADGGIFSGHALTLTEAGVAVGTINFAGSYTADAFTVLQNSDNLTVILLACFAAGTHILTPRGEVKVEELQPGDTVITRNHGDAPILWIGKRHLDFSRHNHPASAQPICIQAGALGENTPSHDLILSPDHALYLRDHLVPAKALINHHNITQLSRQSVTYYHLELAHHDIIFADSTAVETYLESGNRHAFENAGKVIQLHPAFAQNLRENKSCATLIETGAIVNAIRAGIAKRIKKQPSQKSLQGSY